MRFNIGILVGLIFVSCQKEDEGYEPIPEPENELLEFVKPEHFPELTYDLAQNPPTEKGFELGKKLFYEGDLSSDGTVSCGFCHIQDFAFTHHTHIVSHGVEGKLGTRNAQPLFNMAFMNDFTWDGAVSHLDQQPIVPITSPVEMNEQVGNVIEKLKQDDTYVELFAAAFDNQEVNTENMLKALSQFVVMMVSANTKYDRVLHNSGDVFTEEEQQGKAIFEQKCATCHAGILFTDQSYRNNGLQIDPEYNDIGRERVTGLAQDNRKFKVPTLRNIEITYPYMHDGRFQTLRDVLDFYDEGVEVSETLDAQLQQNGTIGIPLTEEEKDLLLTFFKTLNDDNFLFDDRFSEF
ncbi:cytochrome-c peroxidase [Mesonia sp. K7]|uniref:cytochrome-c peroxidase n=1 Tax=Mesonia sp. K7 TaxID=2218606 RepID=UPI000DA7523C|nr:cytochrome c peroxidase [Mesonia sp. K7]PZD78446.1 cytochrome-c peroxidase [Mesonia sp. K7]